MDGRAARLCDHDLACRLGREVAGTPDPVQPEPGRIDGDPSTEIADRLRGAGNPGRPVPHVQVHGEAGPVLHAFRPVPESDRGAAGASGYVNCLLVGRGEVLEPVTGRGKLTVRGDDPMTNARVAR